MATVAFNQLWNGLSNQPPWRKHPGQVEDALNLRLAIESGATKRNGTDLVRYLTELPSSLDHDDIYWTSFRGDLIAIANGAIRAFNGSTGIAIAVVDETDGSYLSGATKADIDTTSIRNSVVILNRSKVTATETSPGYTLSGEVSLYSDLPETATIGQFYKVTFSDGGIPAGYYRRIDLGSGNLSWQRVAAPNQPNARLDASTMPHQLLRLSDGTYSLSEIEWTDRRSGDDETNPAPEWIGEPLQTICYHANRLFLVSAGIISATSSRDLTLLYLNDIDAPSDESNYISVDIANAQAGTPLSSISLGASLFLACQSGQLVFTSGNEQLTSINGIDVAVGSYKTRPIRPSHSNGSLKLLDYQNVLHEFVADDSLVGVRYNGDLNSHALKVLKGDAAYTAGEAVEVRDIFTIDQTTFITTNGYTRVHEKTVDAGNLVQTGWGKFSWNTQYSGLNSIQYLDQWEDKIRLIVKTPAGFALLHYVHKAEDKPASFNYAPHLDFRQTLTGSYIQERNVTRFQYANSTDRTRVVTPGSQNLTLAPVARTSTYIEVLGKWESPCVVGNMFYAYMDLGEFYAGASSVKPTIASMTVFYQDSVCFDVLLRRRGNSGTTTQREYRYRTQQAGADLITEPGIQTGARIFNILQDGRNLFVRLEDQSATPLTLSALEFDVRFSKRGVS